MKNQNSMRKRFASLFLILAVTVTMCLGMPGISFAGDQLNPVDMKIIVDAKDPVTVKAYNASYTYNTYVSMRDMAKALSGTAKGFAMTFDEESETMVIETGEVYTPVGGENESGDGQGQQSGDCQYDEADDLSAGNGSDRCRKNLHG